MFYHQHNNAYTTVYMYLEHTGRQ